MGLFDSVFDTIDDVVDGIGNNIEYRDDVRSQNLEVSKAKTAIAAEQAKAKIAQQERTQQLITTVSTIGMLMLFIIVGAYVYKMVKK